MGTVIVEEEYVRETCCQCGVTFYMPTAIREVGMIRAEQFLFWCPNGHSQHYVRAEATGDDPNPGAEAPNEDEPDEEKVIKFPRVVAAR